MKNFYTKKLVEKNLLLDSTTQVLLKGNMIITRTYFWGLITTVEEILTNQEVKDYTNKSLGFNNKK